MYNTKILTQTIRVTMLRFEIHMNKFAKLLRNTELLFPKLIHTMIVRYVETASKKWTHGKFYSDL